ncbi:MAG TPA: hypothetical protein VFA90_15540 [Terriglobales bacterium]|nr:hypothetical protein [Terriglobales bacterium]
MKRVVLSNVTIIIFALASCTFATAQSEPQAGDSQSLGDYARALKKSKTHDAKPASTVYDNDNLPSATSVNVVGGSTSSSAYTSNTPDANAAQQQNQDDPSTVKTGQSVQDREKAYDSWKQKIDAQKEKVDQLSHDLDEAKNHPSSTTTVPVWPYNTDYQKDVAEKQKALDQAKAELDQMQDAARKQGVPNSVAQ